MNIIDFALSKARVFVGILVFIIVSGAATYITIPKESTPDVNTVSYTHLRAHETS